MHRDSLAKLELAFELWRRKRKHGRERVPDDLSRQACAAIEVHGVSRVAKATKMQISRLRKRLKEEERNRLPAYSRIELRTLTGPLAEVETPSGLKLKVFSVTPEMVSLLSALSGVGVMS